jgi:hypothetical protein
MNVNLRFRTHCLTLMVNLENKNEIVFTSFSAFTSRTLPPLLITRRILFDNKTSRGTAMNNELSAPLREQALEALEESTKMLEVACNLLEQGNRKEAKRLQKAARTKRNVSVLLMVKANALENASRSNSESRYYDGKSSMGH